MEPHPEFHDEKVLLASPIVRCRSPFSSSIGSWGRQCPCLAFGILFEFQLAASNAEFLQFLSGCFIASLLELVHVAAMLSFLAKFLCVLSEPLFAGHAAHVSGKLCERTSLIFMVLVVKCLRDGGRSGALPKWLVYNGKSY